MTSISDQRHCEHARTSSADPSYATPESGRSAVRSRVASLTLEGRNPQFRNRICARICARDAARQAETEETRKTWGDFAEQTCQGQGSNWRLPEIAETGVVRLITQRRPALSFARSEDVVAALELALLWP